VSRRLRPTALATDLLYYINAFILTKMFQDLNIDSDMPGANENYFVSTYLTDFNYRHLMSKITINKSAFADVCDFP